MSRSSKRIFNQQNNITLEKDELEQLMENSNKRGQIMDQTPKDKSVNQQTPDSTSVTKKKRTKFVNERDPKDYQETGNSSDNINNNDILRKR